MHYAMNLCESLIFILPWTYPLRLRWQKPANVFIRICSRSLHENILPRKLDEVWAKILSQYQVAVVDKMAPNEIATNLCGYLALRVTFPRTAVRTIRPRMGIGCRMGCSRRNRGTRGSSYRIRSRRTPTEPSCRNFDVRDFPTACRDDWKRRCFCIACWHVRTRRVKEYWFIWAVHLMRRIKFLL